LAVTFHLMASMVAKRVPLRPIFRVGNSQKSLGARSGGGWVMTQHTLCGSVCYRDAETSVPACHFLCRTCTVTLFPGSTNSLSIKPLISNTSGNSLTAPFSIHYNIILQHVSSVQHCFIFFSKPYTSLKYLSDI
jgi:hypothetical protein